MRFDYIAESVTVHRRRADEAGGPMRRIGRASDTSLGSAGFLGSVSGKREQHIVQRWLVQPNIGDSHASRLEFPDRARDHRRAVRGPHGNASFAFVDRWLLPIEAAKDGDRVRELMRFLDLYSEHSLHSLVLQFVGRPLRQHLAVVDHGDLVGERVGFLEVLRRQ